MTAEDIIKENLKLKGVIALAWGNYEGIKKLFEEQKALIEEQKKQIIKFDNQYKELLEEINEDLQSAKYGSSCFKNICRIHEKYQKKLWSQKK